MLNTNLWWKLFRSIPAQFKNSTIEKAVTDILKLYKVPFYLDDYGNIYNVSYKGRPLLNAHLDSVQEVMAFPADMRFQRSDVGHIFKGRFCLGADDKVGLYIALNYLRDNPDTNFLFTQAEETGCKGVAYWLRNNSGLLRDVTFGLTLDRRGAHDIICTDNKYGTQEFEDMLVEVSAEGDHGFKPARGLSSDADKLSVHISCANLSVGYYEPHTNNEYVIMSEVATTERFVQDIIGKMGDVMYEKPEKWKTVYGYPQYQGGYTKPVSKIKTEKEKKKDEKAKAKADSGKRGKIIMGPHVKITQDLMLYWLDRGYYYFDGAFIYDPETAKLRLEGIKAANEKVGGTSTDLN